MPPRDVSLPSQPATPRFLIDLAQRVEEYVAALLQGESERWIRVNPILAMPFEEMRGLVLAGGKRLRPAFCHWGSIATGGEPGDERVVRAGAALELLHAFALFHDDIMDGSLTRRGEKTTHTRHAELHKEASLDGDPVRYGDGVAILVGDLTYVYADELMADASLRARALWTELRLELNIGQILDIVGSARRERRRAQAEQICRYKSGKYTIERPIQLGALVTSEDLGRDVLDQLSAIGLPLGDAFQMRDDVLGVFGKPEVTGKPAGDDLREGKPTPLLALATERASAAQVEILNHVGRPDITSAEVEAIQDVIVETGALHAMEENILLLTNESLRHLELMATTNTSVTAEAISEFHALAELVSWRNV